MKNAIGILKKSLESIQGEIKRLQVSVETVTNDLESKINELEMYVERQSEVELAILKLEGTKHEQAPSQSKKTKRSSSNT